MKVVNLNLVISDLEQGGFKAENDLFRTEIYADKIDTLAARIYRQLKDVLNEEFPKPVRKDSKKASAIAPKA